MDAARVRPTLGIVIVIGILSPVVVVQAQERAGTVPVTHFIDGAGARFESVDDRRFEEDQRSCSGVWFRSTMKNDRRSSKSCTREDTVL